ncbi:hypothetical protein L1987_31186 [Smallanthus sonchifolius]|uniref:Uncharacterized protein n=1 Tax=Smallanthus sonchifolius TaxID=185202 RepID=A0ACB9I5U3_9ASTR|nr:hypothetical protein L1987_31186 [Smallanthus sonchifolius]
MELDPRLLEKEIVVTYDNQIEWEKILTVPFDQPELPKVGPKERSVAQDIMMVENQIPFMVLKEIDETLQASSDNSSRSVINLSPSIFRVFCEIHSPLKLCSKSQAPSSVDHLLHYMYYSIVNNVPEVTLPDDQSHKIEKPDIPVKEIVKAYEQTISMLETFSHTKTIKIPSASTLHHKAGFQFHILEDDEGIQNVRVRGYDIYLPSITLNNDSEAVLRNLVAYETLIDNPDSFPLNEYMGMMCGLIMSKDDANYLQNRNVITGDMGADEVAKLFIGMSGSIRTEDESEIQVAGSDR